MKFLSRNIFFGGITALTVVFSAAAVFSAPSIFLYPPFIQKGNSTFIKIHSQKTPKVFVDGKKLPVFEAEGFFLALLAVDIEDRRKEISLKVMEGVVPHIYTLPLQKARYRTRHLYFPPPKWKFFRKEAAVKSQKFNKLVHKTRTEISKKRYVDRSFSLPLKKINTANLFFGDFRIIHTGRKVTRRYFHRGIDFGAPKGTAVYASAPGKVVLARTLYKRGNAVIIDHGCGIFTEYLHLSRILVRKGQTVSQEQIIGKVGNTGVSTGPHLHWSLVVNGVLVNPLFWIRPVVAAIFQGKSVAWLMIRQREKIRESDQEIKNTGMEPGGNFILGHVTTGGINLKPAVWNGLGQYSPFLG